MTESPLPRPLYLMVKPPIDLAEEIATLSRSDGSRPELYHATLLLLGERRTMPGQLEAAAKALEGFEADAARAVFDRVHDSGSSVVLRGSETIHGLCRLQKAMRRHLEGRGLTLPRYDFTRTSLCPIARMGAAATPSIRSAGWSRKCC